MMWHLRMCAPHRVLPGAISPLQAVHGVMGWPRDVLPVAPPSNGGPRGRALAHAGWAGRAHQYDDTPPRRRETTCHWPTSRGNALACSGLVARGPLGLGSYRSIVGRTPFAEVCTAALGGLGLLCAVVEIDLRRLICNCLLRRSSSIVPTRSDLQASARLTYLTHESRSRPCCDGLR